MGLHAFKGCDTTRAFVRQGKIKPMKLLEQNVDILPVFCRIGSDIVIQDADIKLLEKFVCKMYHPNKPFYDDIVFIKKIQPKSLHALSSTDGIDLSLLPPCRSTLKMHIVRSNYQSLI